MQDILFSLIIFVIIYLFYLLTVITRKKKLDKLMEGMEVNYLKVRYKLSLINVNKKKLAHIIALTNSFIVSITVLLVSLIENYILKLMVGFVILLPLIILAYHLIGLYLKRSEKNV